MQTASESESVSQIEPHGEYTSPLGLVARLKQREIKFDVVPVLDLIVIALLVSLVFTRFVMLPGLRVDLPTTDFAHAIYSAPGCGSHCAEPWDAVF